MLKRLMYAVLFGCLGTSVTYGEPVSSAEGQTVKAAKPLTIEQRLMVPAEVEFGDAETMTFGELLSQLEERHGIAIQIHRSATQLMMLTLGETLVSPSEISLHGRTQADVVTDVTVPVKPPTNYPADVQYIAAAPVSNEAPQCNKCQAAEAVLTQTGVTISDPECKHYVVQSEGKAPPLTSGDAPALIEIAPLNKPGSPVPPATVQPEAPPADSAPLAADVEVEDNESSGEPESTLHALGACQNMFLLSEVSTAQLRSKELSVEQILRRAIAQIATPLDAAEEMSGMPVAYSHAYDWDLLIDENCVFITTRLHTNLHKVAKVYRIPADSELDAEEVALVLRKTIRPWSWQDQIDDVVEMVKFELPPGMTFPSLPNISGLDLSKLAGVDGIIQVQSVESSDGSEVAEASAPNTTVTPTVDSAASLLAMKAMGSLMSSGTIAAAHAVVNTTEMVHFADPPTATVQVLPGMLIISQSQSAHKEIADLLEQILEVKQE